MPDASFRRFLVPTALIALVVLSLFAGAPAASAAAKTCGEKVVDDWYGDGRVDQIFPAHCYLDAIRSLPVDVKDYSNAEEDIRRALAYARLHKTDPGPTGGPAPTQTSTAVEPPTTTHGGTGTIGPDSSGPVDTTDPGATRARRRGSTRPGRPPCPSRSSSSVVSRCSCSPRAVPAT